VTAEHFNYPIHEVFMRRISLLVEACILLGLLAPHPGHAGNIVVGVNSWYTPPTMPQDDMVKQLATNGVKTIRLSLLPGNADFVIKAYRHGVGAVAIVYSHTDSTAKPRRVSEWASVPLSELDPQEFAQGFKAMLDYLESAGVPLAAIELGNEINTSGYNGDIASPGSGRVLGLSDLNNPNDAEARPIAAGYRLYVKIMAELKQLRDHSKLNQHTPIISAGMANWGRPGPKAWDGLLGVSLVDAIEFLRQSGIDKYVDGYGVHVYPGLDPSRSVATRIASLGENIFANCTPAKPCWLTEWGIPDDPKNPDRCPLDETARLKVIEELRGAFKHFVDQGRLAAIIYYDWLDKPGQSQILFRCGGITKSGKLVLSPM
jgi:hypothetical protein